MALNMFVKAVGQKSGTLAGSVMTGKYKGWVRVQSFSWGMDTPIDAASGVPTGRHAHRRLSLVFADAPAAALLAGVEATNGTLNTVTLAVDGPAPNGTGKVVRALTITLTNAVVTGFSISGAEPDGAPHQQVTFAYQKIRYEASPNTFADAWEGRI